MVGERRRPMAGERRRLGRRRARARALLRLAVPMALSAVVVVLAVSAVAQIGRSSGPYRRTVDRGYAALAEPLAAQSNAVGRGAGLVPARRRARSAASRSSPTSTSSPPTPPRTATTLRRHHPARSRRRAPGARRPSPTGPPRCRPCVARSRASSVAAPGSAPSTKAPPPRPWARPVPPCGPPTRRGRACRRALRRAPGSARPPGLGVGPRPGRVRAAAPSAGWSARWRARIRWPRCTTSPCWPSSPTRPRWRAGRRSWCRRPRASSPTSWWPTGATWTRRASSSVGWRRLRGSTRRSPVLVQRTVDLAAGAVHHGVAPGVRGAARAPPTPCRSWRESPRVVGDRRRWRRARSRSKCNRRATLTSVTSSPLVAVRGRPVTLIADVTLRRSRVRAPHRDGRLRRRRRHHPGVRGPARPRRAGHVLDDLPGRLGARHHRRVLGRRARRGFDVTGDHPQRWAG